MTIQDLVDWVLALKLWHAAGLWFLYHFVIGFLGELLRRKAEDS